MKATDSLDIDWLSNSHVTCKNVRLVNLDHLDCLDPSNIDFAKQGGPSLHIFAPGETFCMTKNQNVGWFWCFMMFLRVLYVLCLGFWMQMLLDKTQSLILRLHVMWNEQHESKRHLHASSASLSPSDPIVTSDTDCTDRPIEGPVARDLWHWKTQ